MVPSAKEHDKETDALKEVVVETDNKKVKQSKAKHSTHVLNQKMIKVYV